MPQDLGSPIMQGRGWGMGISNPGGWAPYHLTHPPLSYTVPPGVSTARNFGPRAVFKLK